MAKFGYSSLRQLETCDPRLQRLFNEVIKYWDCTILEGHRSQTRQDELYARGRTAPGDIVTWVRTGKHNMVPSLAVDVTPYPIDWNNHDRLVAFAGFVLGISKMLDLKIRWGGDWNRNLNPEDEKSPDLPHFEIENETR
jgi:peptidoglycan L-alanyl-D-glutamate endopeptidase CwlK